MKDCAAAASLAALGHEARLKLFRLLIKAGPDGLTVGEIVRHLGLAPSTLSHHLGALVAAGLVSQERRGRETVNRADFAAMRALLAYVESECCTGVSPGVSTGVCAAGDAA
ncbi:MAG: ArsR/SmtB family transcription factor [Rubrimonas sp.]|uniref:ArsR/SmtB family transcription factor n=1 Tax=Rubrimonas sp. TaxID=2036015 RepID=UPI002FDD1969